MKNTNLGNEWINDAVFSANLSELSARFPNSENENSILFVARGLVGNRWFYDQNLGYNRLVDPYSENVPEALINWCSENDWKLYIFFEGVPPEFDESHQRYSERYPDICEEVYFTEMPAVIPRRAEISVPFEKSYSDELLSDPVFRDAFSYQGINFADTMEEQFTNLPNYAAGHVHAVARWMQILRAIKPQAMFAGRLDVRPDICKACNTLGIMTVGIKLGIAEEMLAPFAMRNDEGQFNSEAFPDVLAIWGESQKALIEDRFPDCTAKLIATGRTRNDTFVDVVSNDSSELYEYLELDSSTDLIIYGANFATKFGKMKSQNFGACCMSPVNYKKYLQSLLSLCIERGNCAVLVKPHPADDIPYIREMIEELKPGPIFLITNSDPFHNSDILSAASVFVSTVSSMFSEAVLSGCAAVNVWVKDVNYLYESSRRSAFAPISIDVDSTDSMQSTITKLLDDPDYKEAEMNRMLSGLTSIFGSDDGDNSTRMVENTMLHYKNTWRKK